MFLAFHFLKKTKNIIKQDSLSSPSAIDSILKQIFRLDQS